MPSRILVRLDVHTAMACPCLCLPGVPGKHPFVLDYFMILKVHSISGTGVRLRNLNTFCNSSIARHWNKSPPEAGWLPWVGRFLILQYSVALKTVASEGCHFKRIYIWNFIKYISLMKSLVTCWGGKKGRFSKGFGSVVSEFSLIKTF